MVNRMASSIRNGNRARYARCDHSLCTPAVIPKPDVYIVPNAEKTRFYLKSVINKAAYFHCSTVVTAMKTYSLINKILYHVLD